MFYLFCGGREASQVIFQKVPEPFLVILRKLGRADSSMQEKCYLSLMVSGITQVTPSIAKNGDVQDCTGAAQRIT